MLGLCSSQSLFTLAAIGGSQQGANSTVGGSYQDNSRCLNLHVTEIASLHQDNMPCSKT